MCKVLVLQADQEPVQLFDTSAVQHVAAGDKWLTDMNSYPAMHALQLLLLCFSFRPLSFLDTYLLGSLPHAADFGKFPDSRLLQFHVHPCRMAWLPTTGAHMTLLRYIAALYGVCARDTLAACSQSS